jgi:hypothetical protein
MTKDDFTKIEMIDTAHILHIMPIQELQSVADGLSIEQLTAVLLALKESKGTQGFERLRALIHGIDDKKKLETIGKNLELAQVISLLGAIKEVENGLQIKLSPILVGMPHHIFSSLLATASPDHCEILKQECNSESLLYHLTIISHELENLSLTYADILESLNNEIASLSPRELSRVELSALNKKITTLSDSYEELLIKINKLLLITWNTSRADLLEKLSSLKESITKILLIRIGKPRTPFGTPTGLFQELEKSLNAIFGNPNDPQDIEALRDDEPAIEALVKFSIWYLQDYWELGLLPNIKKAEDLDLNPQEHSLEDRQEHQKKLFEEVEMNLSSVGLKTVRDLKRQGICSRKTLREFIQK